MRTRRLKNGGRPYLTVRRGRTFVPIGGLAEGRENGETALLRERGGEKKRL